MTFFCDLTCGNSQWRQKLMQNDILFQQKKQSKTIKRNLCFDSIRLLAFCLKFTLLSQWKRIIVLFYFVTEGYRYLKNPLTKDLWTGKIFAWFEWIIFSFSEFFSICQLMNFCHCVKICPYSEFVWSLFSLDTVQNNRNTDTFDAVYLLNKTGWFVEITEKYFSLFD